MNGFKSVRKKRILWAISGLSMMALLPACQIVTDPPAVYAIPTTMVAPPPVMVQQPPVVVQSPPVVVHRPSMVAAPMMPMARMMPQAMPQAMPQTMQQPYMAQQAPQATYPMSVPK
ncbi:hypothetical protein ACQZV8_09200 [Magnetococcales bacterium HHB-1]